MTSPHEQESENSEDIRGKENKVFRLLLKGNTALVLRRSLAINKMAIDSMKEILKEADSADFDSVPYQGQQLVLYWRDHIGLEDRVVQLLGKFNRSLGIEDTKGLLEDNSPDNFPTNVTIELNKREIDFMNTLSYKEVLNSRSAYGDIESASDAIGIDLLKLEPSFKDSFSQSFMDEASSFIDFNKAIIVARGIPHPKFLEFDESQQSQ